MPIDPWEKFLGQHGCSLRKTLRKILFVGEACELILNLYESTAFPLNERHFFASFTHHMSARSVSAVRQKLKSVDINTLTCNSAWVKMVRSRCREVFGAHVRPCLWQAKVALATLKGGKHVVSISRTGSGKTLTFWIPTLLCTDGILIVVVPLNLLAKQNVDQLEKVGIKAVAITGETATEDNFKVCELKFK